MTDLTNNEELDNFIASLWNQNYSSNKIVHVLYEHGKVMTRNAVVGRIYRLQGRGVLHRRKNMVVLKKITTDNKETLKPTKKRFIPDRLIKNEMIEARKSKHTELRLVNPDTGEGVTIESLCGCKWVMDFKRDGMSVFCNDPIHRKNFCEAHYNISYYVPEKRAKSFSAPLRTRY